MTLSVRFTVRMTEDEKALLEEKASKLNVNSREFVRCATFNYDPPSPQIQVASVDWKIYHLLGQVKFELNKIGTNVNQLAHDANLSVMMGSPMQSQLEELNEFSGCLNQLIGLMSEMRSQITDSTGVKPK